MDDHPSKWDFFVAELQKRNCGNPRFCIVVHAHERDVMEGTLFFHANANLDENRIGVRLRVDSDAGLDEIESYIWRVQMDRLIVLPIEAHRNVEMLIVTKPDLAPELLPVIAAV